MKRYRLKEVIPFHLKSDTDANQAVELFLQCAALNRMIHLGKPDSYKVED
ncbi:MAG: hypothetical protein RMY30_031600 [Nostoc sp. CmiSLP01]|nr:hypothetical protein [Nostoc sp. CmiSLP01]MDZ8288291.1 hypothetical protein [Nostoc sp. ChiSLP01]